MMKWFLIHSGKIYWGNLLLQIICLIGATLTNQLSIWTPLGIANAGLLIYLDYRFLRPAARKMLAQMEKEE